MQLFSWYKFVISKVQDFRGRAGREEFLSFCLFEIIVAAICYGIDRYISGFPICLPLYLVLSVVPFLLLCVRRLHDVGFSGIWIIAVIALPILLLPLAFWPSDKEEPNKYGYTERLVNDEPKPFKPLAEGAGYMDLVNVKEDPERSKIQS